ncbi:rhamnogalacturonan lyase [Ectobacillus funiculus]|uniref:rhamnogalacturonan lyase n=1 Tax=Ectobacillus funiculus TaxID=137993 RepID=UPI00101BEAA8|nr:rhamnogalacturonan lyase [Ectobacillus funiculus]
MDQKKSSFVNKALTVALTVPMLFTSIDNATAAHAQKEREAGKGAGVQLEYLDRGLAAAPTSEGVFLSWRLLANEVNGYSNKGLTGANFNVYRDGKKIATVEDSTNYLDKEGSAASKYYVSAVVNGKEVDQSSTVTPWRKQYYDLKLKKPTDGITPAGETYTYSANDMSVGDVDGDGQYEYFVKWDPSNSKDVSIKGYTGNVYIDCYKFDGTLLYRIDLGVNIRAGAHYTQFMVYDFDGDGKAEMMFKTAPGTKVIKFDTAGNIVSEKYITMPQEDIQAGYSNEDDYRMSASDYYEHVVNMFMGWDKHEEVVNGHWPKTLEECFGIEKKYNYPLSRKDAESLADYFIDVYAPSRSSKNELRKFEGFIVDGPEYLTVFNGADGAELETIHYKTERHDDGLMWGDYALPRIEPANRVDRFLAGVAYLDGEKPYAVFARGYYTRSTLVSYSWDGTHLKEHWYADSGWTPMSNPFNDNPHGKSGTDPEYGAMTNQGAHSLSAADVDGDGYQEIVYGGATIDHDGSLLYSSMDVLPPQSASPGTTARLGHGDALHVTDIDPDRPGLETFMVHENATSAPYGYSLRDSKTGKVLSGGYTGKDTGRGMVGDIDPSRKGLETWAVGTWTAAGEKLSSATPGTNMNIKWSADMTTQIVNGAQDVTPTIEDWKKGQLLTATDTRTNNGTKGNPSLVADVLGDWREELLVRTADSSAIRMYLSTEVTDRKLYTLMQDPQYRAEVARQNTTYNQPSYTNFYFASDTDWSKVPIPSFWTPGVMSVLENLMNEYKEADELTGPIVPQLTNSYNQAKHQLEKGSVQNAIKFIKKYLSELNGENNQAHTISDRAKQNLSHHAQLLIEMWEKEEKK